MVIAVKWSGHFKMKKTGILATILAMGLTISAQAGGMNSIIVYNAATKNIYFSYFADKSPVYLTVPLR